MLIPDISCQKPGSQKLPFNSVHFKEVSKSMARGLMTIGSTTSLMFIGTFPDNSYNLTLVKYDLFELRNVAIKSICRLRIGRVKLRLILFLINAKCVSFI